MTSGHSNLSKLFTRNQRNCLRNSFRKTNITSGANERYLAKLTQSGSLWYRSLSRSLAWALALSVIGYHPGSGHLLAVRPLEKWIIVSSHLDTVSPFGWKNNYWGRSQRAQTGRQCSENNQEGSVGYARGVPSPDHNRFQWNAYIESYWNPNAVRLVGAQRGFSVASCSVRWTISQVSSVVHSLNLLKGHWKLAKRVSGAQRHSRRSTKIIFAFCYKGEKEKENIKSKQTLTVKQIKNTVLAKNFLVSKGDRCVVTGGQHFCHFKWNLFIGP